MLELEALHKRYGDDVALDGALLTVGGRVKIREAWRAAGELVADRS